MQKYISVDKIKLLRTYIHEERMDSNNKMLNFK